MPAATNRKGAFSAFFHSLVNNMISMKRFKMSYQLNRPGLLGHILFYR